MDKVFSPAGIENRWYQTWEENGYFAPQGGEKAFSIPIPPPMSLAPCIWVTAFNKPSWMRSFATIA